ncbi:MAG: hypothetical protein JKY59_07470 [Emcibacter sp.]|nr:hypothetical protein [Emcibacter sp.]
MTAVSNLKTKARRKEYANSAERRQRNNLADIPAGTSYYDVKFGTMVHKINEGGFCVLSRTDHLIMTTLGSCISVCMFDPVLKVGGMNHFLLPQEHGNDPVNSFNLRYGNNAMETLLNEILKRGGQKSRLVLKAFGAGNVLNISANIGAKNQAFLTQYIADEGMTLDICDLGGKLPRGVIFYPATGKAFVKLLHRSSDGKIGRQEEKFRQKIEKQHVSGAIELF